jgi:hypothetical protein
LVASYAALSFQSYPWARLFTRAKTASQVPGLTVGPVDSLVKDYSRWTDFKSFPRSDNHSRLKF